MCGIAGIYSYAENAAPVSLDELCSIREHMIPRGPDGAGIWVSEDKRIGFAHRRLAILDLSDMGHQPMLSESGDLVISFNGEIYNYPELFRHLSSKGYRFRSKCDTEVLLHLYRESGLEMFSLLRGMFALVLWDVKERRLVAARDTFGIKPLYYSDDGSTVRFASQVKALLAGNRIIAKPSEAGHVGFALWGSVPEPHTLYSSIKALPSGHFMTIRQGHEAEIHAFCTVTGILAEGEASSSVGAAGNPEELRSLLLDSLSHHLLSDVPVAVFLSAGRDSSTIAALCSETKKDIRSFSLGFDEYRGTPADETGPAECVARQYGLQHVTGWISSKDFNVEDIINAMDQPSIDGVNSYLVSQSAARAGLKVALSGLGGDEIFGGYPYINRIPQVTRWLRNLPRVPAKMLARVLPARKRKYAGLFEYGRSTALAYILGRCLNVPWRIEEFFEPEFFSQGLAQLDVEARVEQTIGSIRSHNLQMAALELGWYTRNQLLRDVDWASMAHSLEVRVPLLDVPLLKAVARRRGTWTKSDLARTPKVPLPSEILLRPKTGFSLPVDKWINILCAPSQPDHRVLSWYDYVYRRWGFARTS